MAQTDARTVSVGVRPSHVTQPHLTIGKTGQLARALSRIDPGTVCLPRHALDLTWPTERLHAELTAAIKAHDPRGIVLAAAYTQVDTAETDRDTAFTVNAQAPGVIAQVCAERDLPLVHISTDYVFDGQSDQPWRVTDATAPLNVYGHTKLAGEQAVLATAARAAILRTSWVYDLTGRNFVTTMLRLAKDNRSLSIVDDQIGRPTFVDDLAQAALAALGHTGLYHVSGTGDPVSWAGFARAIFETAKLDVTIEPVTSAAFPTAAERPAFSVLHTNRFETEIAPLPDWRDALARAFSRTG